ncbi:hypothetical protein ACFLUX_03590 [Chloroflexota bacterium]
MDVSFSIPVSGTIHIKDGSMTITVNKAETKLSIPFPEYSIKFSELGPGETLDKVVLEAARELVTSMNTDRFSARDLFEFAIEKHPRLNKSSFLSRIVASTPNHPSYRHFASGKDYFEKIGRGLYQLNSRYLPDPITPTLFTSNP